MNLNFKKQIVFYLYEFVCLKYTPVNVTHDIINLTIDEFARFRIKLYEYYKNNLKQNV